MSDPSDAQGGDYGGGDDERNVAPFFTTGAQSFQGNTYAGAYTFIFPAQADPGRPDTAKTFSIVSGAGSINASTGVYSYTLPQGQTASGSVVIKVANQNGEALQTWNYNVVSTNPPYFISSPPGHLAGDVTYAAFSKSLAFVANRGAPNTSSPINWSISPATFGSTFTGSTDAAKNITLTFPQLTPQSGNITVTISNANGASSQTFSYAMAINGGDGGGGGSSSNYWALSAAGNSIYNTNAVGDVKVSRNLQVEDIATVGDALECGNVILTNSLVGWVIQRVGPSDLITSSPVTPMATLNFNNAKYAVETIINEGRIDWKFISNAPNFATASSADAATGLGIVGTVLGGLLAGGLAAATFSERFEGWARRWINLYDPPPPFKSRPTTTARPRRGIPEWSGRKSPRRHSWQARPDSRLRPTPT